LFEGDTIVIQGAAVLNNTSLSLNHQANGFKDRNPAAFMVYPGQASKEHPQNVPATS
jgi:hypothetical protein